MVFKLIRFTTDEKIKGKGENHTIKICNSFDDYRFSYKLNDYLDKFDEFCLNMPNEIEGHLLNKKSTVDFMDTMPFILGLQMIVSKDFISLLEKLKVNNTEYFIKSIKIKDLKDDFFVFFVPITKSQNINFQKSVIYEGFHSLKEERKYINFNNFDEFSKHSKVTFEKTILPNSFSKKDIISVQGLGTCAFSKRLYEAIIENGLIGIEHDYTQELVVL